MSSTRGAASPTREDAVARSLSARLGGPVGTYARRGVSRWSPFVALCLVTTAVFALGLIQKAPCHAEGWPRGDDAFVFSHLCYSDVPFLYRERGFAAGNVAYIDSGAYPALEYPVLTGAFMQVAASLTQLVGMDDPVEDSVLFFDVTAILLFACALLVVWATSRAAGPRPYDAMMVAAAPVLALAGVINWDLFAVALTGCAVVAWSRYRPGVAGILLGLATAAKFYPLLLFGPLFILALRGSRLRHWGAAVTAAALTWTLVNLPVMVLAFGNWQAFWSFNERRGAEFGSVWYAVGLAGVEIPNINLVSLIPFAVACGAIGALGLLAPRRPRVAQLAFLTVAAFLLFNKVYSPQYVLWLLPLLALARPRWRDWMIWQGAEAVYWLAIWLHIAGLLDPNGGLPDRLYWLAVAIRVAATVYLCALVVRDILRPWNDLVRRDGQVDDPAGGPLDGVPDAGWRQRWARG